MNAGLLAEYTALEAQILAGLRDDLSEVEFDTLALAVHRFQRRWNAPYGAWCETRPAPQSWREIPAVPQAMFKRFRLSCFPPELAAKTFRTSGTTGETRGEVHLRDTGIYDAALLAGWRRVHAPAKHAVFLTPSPENVPDSSLFHMFGEIAREHFPAGVFMCDSAGRLDAQRMETVFFGLIQSSETVAVFGTALGFLHFFDWLGERRIHLAKGSYALETGGFKGSGRDIAKAELYALFQHHLGLPTDGILNEYGMCELGSQFYARGLDAPHRGGPWVRSQVVSPESGAEVAIGERGILRLFDLANLSTVVAIQTADVAIRETEGFTLLGRDAAATPRGCSRAADEAMRASRPTRPSSRRVAASMTLPELGNTRERATILAQAAAAFPFLGRVTPEGLLALVSAELGHAEALDRFVPYSDGHARAIPPQKILHILSGNTPAAGLQTLIRGLLLGGRNWCKLPSAGLAEVAQFVDLLPKNWRPAVEVSRQLPPTWLEEANAVVVFGSDETVAHFRGLARPDQIFVPYGHMLSFGIVFEDPGFASAAGAARDASVFDQQGCLSPTVFFIRENGALNIDAYAERLAQEMANFAAAVPPAPLTLSETNSIAALREEAAFRIANGESLRLFTSRGTTWTVLADRSPGFPSSPLNRVVYVKPLESNLPEIVAPLREHLSTIGIQPSTEANAHFAADLGARRICPIGSMQLPPLTWHHDGNAVLAPLVTWVDWHS